MKDFLKKLSECPAAHEENNFKLFLDKNQYFICLCIKRHLCLNLHALLFPFSRQLTIYNI